MAFDAERRGIGRGHLRVGCRLANARAGEAVLSAAPWPRRLSSLCSLSLRRRAALARRTPRKDHRDRVVHFGCELTDMVLVWEDVRLHRLVIPVEAADVQADGHYRDAIICAVRHDEVLVQSPILYDSLARDDENAMLAPGRGQFIGRHLV